jgi:nucleotide-binding universal stress UspA family protein
MTYKTLLVHLDDGTRRAQLLDLAFRLAENYDAHLIGFFALADIPIPAAAPEAGTALIEIERMRVEIATQAEVEFRDKMAREQWTKSEWRSALHDGLGAVRLYSRYADLVIAGQPNGGGVPASFMHELVLTAGRPILYVPYAGRFEDVGHRVFVSWNASREAARAVNDGMPFMEGADDTEVVTFDPQKLGLGRPELPDPDIGAEIARHGAKVTVSSQVSDGLDVGSLILSRAADMEADLIVMGAYGHSRVRELVLGGATKTIFKSMTVPTLMSH